MDLGLIAVGTAESGEVRIRNVGTVPLSFAMVQVAATAGTAAAARAAELQTTTALRDMLLLEQQQRWQLEREQKKYQQQQQKSGRRAVAGAAQAAASAPQPASGGNDLQNDQALARVFGTTPPRPPPMLSPAGNDSASLTTDLPSNGLLVRRNSERSVDSNDSFSVPSDGCRLEFEPAFGELDPARSITITV